MALKFDTILGIDPLKAREEARAAKKASKLERSHQDHVMLHMSGSNPKNKSGVSHKFWEAWVDDSSIYIHFGKIGTEGRTDELPCISNAQARADLADRVRKQRKKGYENPK